MNAYQTTEQIVRQQLHQERTAKVLARTGGEVMHPDHYDFRQAFRDALLSAADEVCAEHGMTKITDADLPQLFRDIDPLTEKLWLRRLGLGAA